MRHVELLDNLINTTKGTEEYAAAHIALFEAIAPLPVSDQTGWICVLQNHLRLQIPQAVLDSSAWRLIAPKVSDYVDINETDIAEDRKRIAGEIQALRVAKQKEQVGRDFNTTDPKKVELLWKLTHGGNQ